MVVLPFQRQEAVKSGGFSSAISWGKHVSALQSVPSHAVVTAAPPHRVAVTTAGTEAVLWAIQNTLKALQR